MKLRFILLAILIIELLFVLFDNDKPTWFPLANLISGVHLVIPNLSYEYIAYYGFEHLSVIALSGIVWYYSNDRFAKYFFVIKCLDFVDFLATYNHVYGHIGVWSISFNTLSICVFILLIALSIIQWVIDYIQKVW